MRPHCRPYPAGTTSPGRRTAETDPPSHLARVRILSSHAFLSALELRLLLLRCARRDVQSPVEFGDRGCVEQVGDHHPGAERGSYPADYQHGVNRLATQVEEVVVDT